MTREDLPPGWAEVLDGMDSRHAEAHTRLRSDLTALERDCDAIKATIESNYRYFEKSYLANQARIDQVERTPPSADKLVFTPRVLILAVTLSLTIAGGVWASTSGLRSDVRDILTRMDAQRQTSEATAKLQEIQSSSVKTAIEDMRRRQELQQYEIQALKEVILTGKGKLP